MEAYILVVNILDHNAQNWKSNVPLRNAVAFWP